MKFDEVEFESMQSASLDLTVGSVRLVCLCSMDVAESYKLKVASDLFIIH